MSQNTPNKAHHTGMGSNLNRERIEVSKQELILVETYTSFNLHSTYIILLPLPITIFYIFICIIILSKTALFASKQMYVYCKLCIAECLNEILV